MSKELEIVGFNGSAIGRVGLAVPIALDRGDTKRPWIRFKVGTGSRDEISDVMFNQFIKEKRVTRLPQIESVAIPEGTRPTDLDCVVGFGGKKLFDILWEVSSQGDLQFEWRDVDDGFQFMTSAPRLQEHPRVIKLRYLRHRPDVLYWIGVQNDRNMLSVWSDALQKTFDRNILEKVKPQSVTSRNKHLEELAWWAHVCAYDRSHLVEANIRLFTSFRELQIDEEELRQRFEYGARLMLRDVSWESFRLLVDKYRETLGKGK